MITPTVSASELRREQLEADPELAAMVEEERRKLEIGFKIQRMRQAAGLTQTQLARMVGTAQSAIARIESGEYERLSLTTLLKVTHALGSSLDIQFRRVNQRVRQVSSKLPT